MLTQKESFLRGPVELFRVNGVWVGQEPHVVRTKKAILKDRIKVDNSKGKNCELGRTAYYNVIYVGKSIVVMIYLTSMSSG